MLFGLLTALLVQCCSGWEGQNESASISLNVTQSSWYTTEMAVLDVSGNVTLNASGKYAVDQGIPDEINATGGLMPPGVDIEKYVHRMVGGSSVDVTDVPYSALIIRSIKGGQFMSCGGNLISDRHVLSAAHCVVFTEMETSKASETSFVIVEADEVTIHLGSKFRYHGGLFIKAEKICVHPDYYFKVTYGRKPATYKDLVVITLRDKITLGPTMQTVQIQDYMTFNQMLATDGKKCVVAGWGRRLIDGELSEFLIQVEVTLLSPYLCWKDLKDYMSLDDTICTEGSSEDSCRGDGGSGLICDGTIWGIVTWRKECGSGKASVYTRVDNEQFFIQQAMKDTAPLSLRPKPGLLLYSASCILYHHLQHPLK